jgi:threonine dehydrogenase-like Zn-dependent dehydrogenase
VVYEVTGTRTALAQAIDALFAGGRLVVVGLQDDPSPIDLRRLTLAEVEFIGTNAHVCDSDLPEALRLLAARGSDWSDVAPEMLPLDELVPGGIQPMADGRSTRIKTLIDPWATRTRSRRLE